jgi:hypothetical protein
LRFLINIFNIYINIINYYIDIIDFAVYIQAIKYLRKVKTMKYKAPSKCPVCGERLSITKLGCSKCSTAIEGDFQPCEFCRLPEDDLEFVKVFIKCRGNIKDVERELGISYPTVRGKLDSVIRGLGYEVNAKDAVLDKELKESARNEILDQLSRGEITAKEATDKIKNL